MIAVIGAGKVGSTAAWMLAQRSLGSIVLLDITKGLAQGEALDMAQAGCFNVSIKGSKDYSDIKGAELVVVTAGYRREPGMKRLDLMSKNAAIVRLVGKKVKKFAPEALIIVATNPVDVMVHLMLKATGFSREKIVGMGSLLDSLRFRYFLSKELRVGMEDVEGLVVGAHNNTMVPLVSKARIRGEPLRRVLSEDRIRRVIRRTRGAGAEIIRLKGHTSWAPGVAIAEIAEAMVMDKKDVLPVSLYLEGEYGIEGVCVGVPARLGRTGAEEVVVMELEEGERMRLMKSANTVKKATGLVR